MTHADVPLIFTEAATDWLDRGPAVQALRRLLDSPGFGHAISYRRLWQLGHRQDERYADIGGRAHCPRATDPLV